MTKMLLAVHDNAVNAFLPDRTGSASRRNTNIVVIRRSSNHRNHGPIVDPPVAPHIAAPIPAESATQIAGAVAETAIGVTRSTTEAAAKVIPAKTITSATATIIAAASKCAGGKPGTSEHKENSKNNYDVAQHRRPL
jgi:hypothetical protein